MRRSLDKPDEDSFPRDQPTTALNFLLRGRPANIDELICRVTKIQAALLRAL
jgi:hypothetical protein